MRAAGSDDAVILTPPRYMSLEDCISNINEDELWRSHEVHQTAQDHLDGLQRKRSKIAARRSDRPPHP
jgi:predicted membrane GTPase involved in stress response